MDLGLDQRMGGHNGQNQVLATIVNRAPKQPFLQAPQ